MLPFQASADINWHHPLALAAQPAARRLIASCHLGTIRVQPAFGHIGLLQALHQQMKAGTDAFEPVSQSVQPIKLHKGICYFGFLATI